MMVRAAWFLALSLFLSGHAHAACDARPGGTRVEGKDVVLVYASRPAQIKVGELFALDVEVCPKNGEARSLGVDATMPEHKHGMNYKPTVRKGTANAYAATGLMFHMPGRWQFAFEVETAGGRERVLHNVTIR